MFWNKKIKPIVEPQSENIHVIPPEFYGAKDPTIFYQGNKAKGAVTVKLGEQTAFAGNGLFSFVKNKIFLYAVAGILLLGAMGGITWYYLNQAGFLNKKQIVIQPIQQEQKTEMTEMQNSVSVQVPPTSTIEIIVPTTTVAEATSTETPAANFDEVNIDFPRTILTDSADTDSDGLTDMEEEVFGTDPGIWDTDKDGYYDGQEVGNLYNPKGIAPVKIIDSGLVQEYANPKWQYRLYYPVTWQMGEVDKEVRQVLFNSVTGDYVEVAVYDLKPGEDFTAWFARKATGQNYTDLSQATNRFQENYYERRDGLVAYFVSADKISVILYHTGVTGYMPFRHVLNMMIQSFRSGKSAIEIPNQVELPTVPTNT